jgi:hypothetical protein
MKAAIAVSLRYKAVHMEIIKTGWKPILQNYSNVCS